MGRGHKETTCFVVIPYGKKPVLGKDVDFDQVFLDLIVPACHRLPDWNIIVERTKDDPDTGSISRSFITDILNADLCIADITGANPNVFYELGLRHAFARKTTLLISGTDTRVPFDVGDISCFRYNIDTETLRLESVKRISDAIKKALTEAKPDSPVYAFLKDLRVTLPTAACETREEVLFRVAGAPPEKHVGVITGALNNVEGVDVWVNSENTEMEMARAMESRVSGVIRYWGGQHHADGRISRDLIQTYLKRKLGSRKTVTPGTVLDTPPGELHSNGVRTLLHVATVAGVPGRGYHVVGNLGQCVLNCLERVTELNRGNARDPLRSILFPIFGTGEGGQSVEEVFPKYLDICIKYLKTAKDDALNKIFFLAFTERERDFLNKEIARRSDLEFESAKQLEMEAAGSDIGVSADAFTAYVKGALNRATEARNNGNLREALKHLHAARTAIEASNWRERFEDGSVPTETLIKICGQVIDVYGGIGGLYRRLGDLENAIKWLETGARIESSDEKFHRFTYNSVNKFVLEVLAERRSELEELRELDHRLQTLVSRGRKLDEWAWADLAVVNILLGRPSESTSQIEKCLSLKPGAWPSLKSTLKLLVGAKAPTGERPDIDGRRLSIDIGGLQNILTSFGSRFDAPAEAGPA